MRETVDGSLEPLWRANARRDADNHRASLFKSQVNRRAFIAGSAALLHEYLAQRRAVASPLFHPGASNTSNAGITIVRTGATQYATLGAAFTAMQTGDTLLLPAGMTYQYGGATKYYCNHVNHSWSDIGSIPPYQVMILGNQFGGFLSATGGTIQGVGSANNGRAQIACPYGILAQAWAPGQTEIFFSPSTPVTNFPTYPTINGGSYNSLLYLPGSYNFGLQANVGIAYTGFDVANNGVTGVSNTFGVTFPVGTIMSAGAFNGKGVIATAGLTAWTLTNIETAYGNNGNVSPMLMASITPDQTFCGSVVCNNCYFHDSNQGFGLGYQGLTGNGISAQLFNTEIYANGNGQSSGGFGQSHNMYIGAIDELLMDNCYSHHTNDDWLVKSRAAMALLTYNQIRGERTDTYSNGYENGGVDRSNGGLTYCIGNIHQQSLLAGPQSAICFAAEAAQANGTNEGGAAWPIQEIYVVNCTIVGPSNGTGSSSSNSVSRAPVEICENYVHCPQITKLSQLAGGSQAARQYWVSNSVIGSGGGETNGSPVNAAVGGGSVYMTLPISASSLLSVASPAQSTGASTWNCYANYADPPIYFQGSLGSQAQEGNFFFWDSAFTQPVFSTPTGGITISCTGTLVSGTNTITSVSGLSGVASLWQLYNLSLYLGGVVTGCYVTGVNPATGTITLNQNYSVSTGAITFGHFLYCGFTYQTALGDSINSALITYTNAVNGEAFGPIYQIGYPTNWTDGSYVVHTPGALYGAAIQVPPGRLLVVNAPPSGPSWAPSGINVWAKNVNWYPYLQWAPYPGVEGYFIGLAKQNSTVIGYGNQYTSPTRVITRTEGQIAPLWGVVPNVFLQNSTPIAFGTPFNEPTSGLVNNNPTKTKLQWFRRASQNNNGATQDAWYAVVPAGGLTSYTETAYLNAGYNISTTFAGCNYQGAISIWRGVTGFDNNFFCPVISTAAPVTISTAAGNVVVLATFRSAGTAGGWGTQITNGTLCNAAYAPFTSAQTGLSITETGGSSTDGCIVDALLGSGAAPTHVSNTPFSSNGKTISFTIASANAGDILYLQLGTDNWGQIVGIGQIAAPPYPSAIGNSPIVQVQNCISVNYNSSFTSGSMIVNGDNGATVGAGQIIAETHNLACNPFNGTTFGTPTFATVFNDPTQSDFNYALASASPAKSGASDPGSVHGQNLRPQSQSSWSGSPTPGTPIPAKATRPDIPPTSIGALF